MSREKQIEEMTHEEVYERYKEKKGSAKLSHKKLNLLQATPK